ncbi:MAG: hypothetical protein N3A63_07245 [Bacteroidetes bacterium]|nr:hypothetical protein [Bacteroidota bacterium]
MIILIKAYGNHTNRLIQNAHLEAFCAYHGIPYFNATLLSMAHHYPLKYNYTHAIFYLSLQKVHYPQIKCRFISFDDESKIEEYKTILQSHKHSLLFVGGWYFREYTTLQQYRSELLRKYETHKTSPRFEYLCNQLTSYDCILGLHIRRKDYQKWQGGKYFYPLELYKQLVHYFFTLKHAKAPFILIFTDDVSILDQLHFDVPYVFSQLPYYLDHKLMGRCHYLLGPPSTFTLWPSFLYQVPYYHIYEPQKLFTLDDFKISIC